MSLFFFFFERKDRQFVTLLSYLFVASFYWGFLFYLFLAYWHLWPKSNDLLTQTPVPLCQVYSLNDLLDDVAHNKIYNLYTFKWQILISVARVKDNQIVHQFLLLLTRGSKDSLFSILTITCKIPFVQHQSDKEWSVRITKCISSIIVFCVERMVWKKKEKVMEIGDYFVSKPYFAPYNLPQ